MDHLSEARSLPLIIFYDTGPKFAGKTTFFWVKDRNAMPGLFQPGEPTQSAFVENLNGKFPNECLNQHWFKQLEGTRWEIGPSQKYYD